MGEFSRRDILHISAAVAAPALAAGPVQSATPRPLSEKIMQADYIPHVRTGSYPARAGNRVRGHIDGTPAFTRICEAVEAARKSVWLTVAFIWPEFQFPGGRGSLFDLLDRAKARGLDVRVIFWRVNPETASWASTTFSGSDDHIAFLKQRGSRFAIRWDRAFRSYANHSKSWLIDAGQDTEVAFVGGSNLNPNHLGVRGHANYGDHDLYLEVAGPCASDVHHNFVQRWNEASDGRLPGGAWADSGDLAFPTAASPARGDSLVQMLRTIHTGRYTNGMAAPGAAPFFIAGGEHSVLEQYLAAIAAARKTIYLEHQAFTVLPILRALDAALKRGVAVTMLLPARDEDVPAIRKNPSFRALYDLAAAMDGYDHFAMAGLGIPHPEEKRKFIHVHAKVMLIDDAWATIGSCNFHENSMYGHAEMNGAIWDAAFVKALRVDLLKEHLGRDTAEMDDRAAFQLYRETARANRAKWDKGQADWQGLVIGLSGRTYGLDLAPPAK